MTGAASFLNLVLGVAATAFVIAAAIDGVSVTDLPSGQARNAAARRVITHLALAISCIAIAISGGLA